MSKKYTNKIRDSVSTVVRDRKLSRHWNLYHKLMIPLFILSNYDLLKYTQFYILKLYSFNDLMLNRIKNSFYGLKVKTFFKLLQDNKVVILKTTFNNFYACIKYFSERFNFTNSPHKLLSIFSFN